MSTASLTSRKRSLRDLLPDVHQLRQSVGQQRGMLVVGLVLTALFILSAIFAAVIARYGFAQSNADG